LHQEKFAGVPLAEVVIFPLVELCSEASAFADAADGYMRMEFAFLAAAGRMLDGGLHGFQLVDVAFESHPKDARIARGREAAEAARPQAQRLDYACQPGLNLLQLFERNVSEELQCQMNLILWRPADAITGLLGEFLLAAYDLLNYIGRDRQRYEGSNGVHSLNRSLTVAALLPQMIPFRLTAHERSYTFCGNYGLDLGFESGNLDRVADADGA